ncbi:MAG: MBL fold metallo-hydrolase [Holophaga sp.]|nr:MBL fold metallo-hydrolase [Holophaga sp.]
MAQRSKSHPDNLPGSFFVDTSCIDCGTCYEYLPWVFREAGGHSRVYRQPEGPSDRFHALKALLACPTGSIGTDRTEGLLEAREGFPDPIEEEVSFCGFTSEQSYGAWSYFIQRPGGNVLVDSPRAVPALLKRLEQMGGVDLMVLSHQDDVADHARFRERFHCRRVLHRADLAEATAGVEQPVEGDQPIQLAPDLLFIPTPGHTAGSACLLYRKKFLFSGDHLWWDPRMGRLSASRAHCWHHWPTQLKSLERLLEYDFSWVLPGHGASHRAGSPAAMRTDLAAAIAQLKRI